MRAPPKYDSESAFLDMVFLLAVGFVVLFITAVLLINPDPIQSDAPKKAEYTIAIEWNEGWNDDVDLWVRSPDGGTVSFRNKAVGFMNLEKDDLGQTNDVVHLPDGTRRVLALNFETVTLRALVPGEYRVMAHIWKRRGEQAEQPGRIQVTVSRINPYSVQYLGEAEYREAGQEITLVNFRLADDGRMTGHNTYERDSIITATAPLWSGAPPYGRGPDE